MSNLTQLADAVDEALASGNIEQQIEAIAALIAGVRAAEQSGEAVMQGQIANLTDIGSEWVPCVKLPVTVHVRQQRKGETHVSTREGITPLQSDDLIMRGVEGEEYPIGRSLFEKTYRIGANVEQSGEAVYLVATGETIDGKETYTRHDVRPPMCDAETLYTHPQPAPATGKESLQVQAVPDGWQLVPIKPTEEMIRKSCWSGAGEINLHEEWAKREVWGRMLAAAPAPDKETTMHHLELIPDTGAAIASVNAAHAAGIIGTDTRTVTIPGCEEHQGFYRLTLTLPWRCMYCGAPRGEPFETLCYDGSRRLNVNGWENPCGHTEKYSAIRARINEEG